VTRYVAFLRAVNVGGAHVVKMEALRRLIESTGAANVQTFIASGNVIFETAGRDASAVERTIEQTLAGALGFSVTTFLRTMPELRAIAAYRPFGASELEPGVSVYIGFLKKRPTKAAERAVAGCRSAVEDFALHEREVYWLRRPAPDARLTGACLGKALGAEMTMRNVTTVRKIAAKYDLASSVTRIGRSA
jgi:uncharacterized protein (DUF1697 family)